MTDNETAPKSRLNGHGKDESLDVEARHGKAFLIGLRARGPRAVDAARWVAITLILGGLVFVGVLIGQWVLQ